MNEDYYNILNITKSASPEDIKKAYRKLAVKWHPDKNQGDSNAEEQFKKISEAYDVLSDTNKKAQYDQFGHSAFKQGSSNHSGGHDPFDVFNSFFGGARVNPGPGFNSSFFTREGPRKEENPQGSNLKLDIEVSLQDIIKEKSINLSYTRFDKCDPCSGTGRTSKSTEASCSVCGGRGSVYRSMGVMQIEQLCPSCNGSGRILRNPCIKCEGSGASHKKMNTKVKIPVGSHNGTRLRVSGMGNYDKGGHGDLYVFISIKNDGIYERNGDDVIRKLHIPFEDMILGQSQTIDSLYGTVKLKIPQLSKPDAVLRVTDHGIPNMNTHRKGDMYIVLSPKFPTNLSSEQESILKLYKKTK